MPYPESLPSAERHQWTDYALPAAIFLVIVWFFYPGFMSADSLRQLSMGRTLQLQDGHPPLLAIIWHFLDGLYPGPALMLLVQAGLLVGSIGLLARQLAPTDRRKRALVYIVPVFPPVFGISGIIWKDVWMQDFLLLGLSLSLIALSATRSRWLLLSAALASFFLAVAMRHNAVAAVPPLVIWIFFFLPAGVQTERPAFRLGAATAAGLVVCAGLFAINGRLTAAVANPVYFSQVVMVFDIAGTSARTGQNLFEGDYPNLLAYRPSADVIKARYTPVYHRCLYVDCPKEDDTSKPFARITHDPNEVETLRRNWIHVVSTHPWQWLAHKAAVARGILNFKRHAWGPTLSDPIAENSLGFVYSDSPLKSFSRDALFWMSYRTPLYDTYLYFLASIVGLVTAVVRTSRFGLQRSMLAASVFLSGLMYEGSLFLGATSPDFRYSVWMIICTLLGFLILITSGQRSPS